MAQNQKSYDNEFKAQAVKLAQEIGGHKAAQELGIPKGTMYTWIKAFKEGRLSANEAVHTPKNALSLNDELIELRKRVKEQDKEIRRLKEENEFLEEASAFFVSAKYCYAAHESRLHQNDRCKRFALCLVLTVRFRSLAPWGKLFQLFI